MWAPTAMTIEGQVRIRKFCKSIDIGTDSFILHLQNIHCASHTARHQGYKDLRAILYCAS